MTPEQHMVIAARDRLERARAKLDRLEKELADAKREAYRAEKHFYAEHRNYLIKAYLSPVAGTVFDGVKAFEASWGDGMYPQSEEEKK